MQHAFIVTHTPQPARRGVVIFTTTDDHASWARFKSRLREHLGVVPGFRPCCVSHIPAACVLSSSAASSHSSSGPAATTAKPCDLRHHLSISRVNHAVDLLNPVAAALTPLEIIARTPLARVVLLSFMIMSDVHNTHPNDSIASQQRHSYHDTDVPDTWYTNS